jgi:outer membrane biosynthesis protein TonB
MKQRRITEVAALRHVLQIKRRLQLELLASISRLLREHEVNADDNLLASLVVAVPEELMDDGSSTLASLRLASNMAASSEKGRYKKSKKKLPKPPKPQKPQKPQKPPKPQKPQKPQKPPKPQKPQKPPKPPKPQKPQKPPKPQKPQKPPRPPKSKPGRPAP